MTVLTYDPPLIISASDTLGAILMEMRYTNYLLQLMIEGRGVEKDSVAGYMAEMTYQDVAGVPNRTYASYAAKQPYQAISTRT